MRDDLADDQHDEEVNEGGKRDDVRPQEQPPMRRV